MHVANFSSFFCHSRMLLRATQNSRHPARGQLLPRRLSAAALGQGPGRRHRYENQYRADYGFEDFARQPKGAADSDG